MEFLRAFRKETVLKPSPRAGNWPVQRANRFAPDLASLRSARPVERLERIDREVAAADAPGLKSGHERFSTVSANFRLGGTVGGGECDP